MTTDLPELNRQQRGPARVRLSLAMLLELVLLFTLSACLADNQAALPTLAPTAAIPATPTLPTSTPPPPPPTLTSPPTAVPPTDTPVINIVTSTATPQSAAATQPAVSAAVTAPANITSTSANITPTMTLAQPTANTIGYSVQGRAIVNYSFGSGPTQLIFVGGVHGGYEWNTILLAYEIIDHYTANPQLVPPSLTVHIIPSANPDGQYLVTNHAGRFHASDVAADTESGRFNANNVDLNRNWDCEWSPTATWRDVTVSGGESPFSEPENIVLRNFILPKEPAIVVFWHSAANGVFAAGCPETHALSLALANIYGRAANYPVYERFTSYDITGDASDWLTTQGISSISVELQNHQSLDLAQNLNGVQAILDHFDQP